MLSFALKDNLPGPQIAIYEIIAIKQLLIDCYSTKGNSFRQLPHLPLGSSNIAYLQLNFANCFY